MANLVACLCSDWRENIDKVEGPIITQALRTATLGYDGKPFKRCPWCGAELDLNRKEEEKQNV